MTFLNVLKKNIILVFLVVIIALGAAGYFVVWPKYQEYKVIKSEFDLKDEEIKAKEEYLPKLEAISKRLTDFAKEIDIIETALPLKPSAAALVKYLELTLSSNGLVFDKADIDIGSLFNGFFGESEKKTGTTTEEDTTTTSRDNVGEVSFGIKVIGSYTSFKGFLEDLYYNARIIEVETIEASSFNPDAEEGEIVLTDKKLMNFELKLKTHLYKEL